MWNPWDRFPGLEALEIGFSPNQTARQCHERLEHNLKPGLERGDFTAEEDLLQTVAEIGKR